MHARCEATSVFTHLIESQAEYYLARSRRVLAPTGVLIATFFLFDKAGFPFMQDIQNALYINHGDPTNAVIFDRRWLQRALARARARDRPRRLRRRCAATTGARSRRPGADPSSCPTTAVRAHPAAAAALRRRRIGLDPAAPTARAPRRLPLPAPDPVVRELASAKEYIASLEALTRPCGLRGRSAHPPSTDPAAPGAGAGRPGAAEGRYPRRTCRWRGDRSRQLSPVERSRSQPTRGCCAGRTRSSARSSGRRWRSSSVTAVPLPRSARGRGCREFDWRRPARLAGARRRSPSSRCTSRTPALWRRVLHHLERDIDPRRSRAIWCTSGLARYTPGSVLMPMVRVAMAQARGRAASASASRASSTRWR